MCVFYLGCKHIWIYLVQSVVECSKGQTRARGDLKSSLQWARACAMWGAGLGEEEVFSGVAGEDWQAPHCWLFYSLWGRRWVVSSVYEPRRGGEGRGKQRGTSRFEIVISESGGGKLTGKHGAPRWGWPPRVCGSVSLPSCVSSGA